MGDLELLLGTHETTQNTTICAWNYTTGNIEHVYKNGGSATSKTLQVMNYDYILTAEQNKPLLHIWPVNSQEQVKNLRFVLPDAVSCLEVNRTNDYLIAGIGTKIYVWHFNSGRLLNILQRHYQPITCVLFSSDSSFILAGGKDGMLVAYKLEDVACHANSFMSQKNIGECEPLYTRVDHSMQICDMTIGSFGHKSKFATVSYDYTCRIYALQTGCPLAVLIFKTGFTSALLDAASWCIYLGDADGQIKRVYLIHPPRMLEQHLETQFENEFLGHKKKITCLALNFSNSILASGSEDCNIIVWDTMNRNILRTIERNGIITNLKFILNHSNFSAQTLKSDIVLQPLQKVVDTNLNNLLVYAAPNKIVFEEKEENNEDETDNEILENAQSQINNLKVINKQLYDAFIKMAKKYNSLD